MHLMVGLQSAWKCVEISLLDGSVPVIGGVPLHDSNIEPAVWFKALVLDSVCIDCSDHVISWAVTNPGNSTTHQSTPSTTSRDHTLMAPHEEGEPSCPDNLHNLFEVAETLFRASPLCSPSRHPRSPPPATGEEWEHQLWLRLLHTLLLPLLTLQREDLPSLQLSLDNYCTHTIARLDSNIAQSTTLAQELKEELDAVRSSLVPLVVISPTSHLHPPHLLSCLNSDLREMEDEARSKVACCERSLALQSRLTASGSPGLDPSRLQTEKRQAEDHVTNSVELRTLLASLVSQQQCCCSSLTEESRPCSESGHLAALARQYLSLHERLSEARASAEHWSRKKVLALSVREAMEQAVASLRTGHVTVGMDVGMHGGHSTDVLPEASQYKAKEEFTTLGERIKQLLDMVHSPAARLHNSLLLEVQVDWFPAMCNDFVVISPTMAQKLPSPRTRSQSWRRHFSLRKRCSPSSPTRPIPTSMAGAGKLLHLHFQEIVSALCDHLADHDAGFQQQVWLCYENLFFDTFSSSFLSHYESENLKFCEQLRVNALSISVLPPTDLPLHIPDTSCLQLFPPRSFQHATQLYSQPVEADVYSDPPHLNSELQANFGPVVTDLYCMVRARAPLQKLQLLTSAFRKTTAALSTLKLESLLEEGSTDIQLARVSCDDLLPLLVLLLLQLPPAFLGQLWLHCLLLEDCCPVFLQAGWHGYSLTTFRSSLTVISEL